MAIVNNGQCAAELGGEKQIDFARACIPGICHELGQSHLGQMRNRAQFTEKVIFLKQRKVTGLFRHQSLHGVVFSDKLPGQRWSQSYLKGPSSRIAS
ncbi:hypothetical protein DOCECA_09355 [Pseudomonas sp. E102]